MPLVLPMLSVLWAMYWLHGLLVMPTLGVLQVMQLVLWLPAMSTARALYWVLPMARVL